MDSPTGHSPHLTWTNVAIGSSFVVFNVVLSTILGLEKDIPASLSVAAIRCVVQLTLLTLVLGSVFKGGVGAVAGVAVLFNVLGTLEAVLVKSKRRFKYMFPSVLVSMAGSTIPVSIIGSRFAMSQVPFWTPENYIPILGMLCGGTISGMVVALSSVLREVGENRDKVETYLAFGASRFEACKPIATEALRLALLPTINQMSVIGLISIPGMMTGALLGGSSLEQAAKLQMVIMFMINASTALAAIVATVLALLVIVDGECRLRLDRVDSDEAWVWQVRDRAVGRVVHGVESAGKKTIGLFRRRRDDGDNRKPGDGAQDGVRNGERQPLLG